MGIGGGGNWSGIASVESHTKHTRMRSFTLVFLRVGQGGQHGYEGVDYIKPEKGEP